MNQGLFESLTGTFLDETPVDAVEPSQRRVRSILDHLNRLLNTRQGSVAHLTDYGLPDVSDIYRRMPDGVDELREEICRTVSLHEPRLENVRVTQRQAQKDDARLAFVLSGQLRGGGPQVRFETVFTSVGKGTISPWKSAG